MSNPFSSGGRRTPVPSAPRGRPIASFRDYLAAQRAVDYLSDEKFPVQHVTIVGTDLKMVERVTGRLTYPRVAAAGLFSGAYFGGFVGLLLGLFGGVSLGQTLLTGILIGAAFGMIFGVISYAATGGRRDFTSTSQIVAGEYAVWCADDHAGEATRVLAGLESSGARTPATGNPFASPQPGQGHSQPAAPQQQQQAQGQDATTAAPVTGPTYSEMIARQKAQREQQTASDEAAAERPATEQAATEQARQDRPSGSSAAG